MLELNPGVTVLLHHRPSYIQIQTSNIQKKHVFVYGVGENTCLEMLYRRLYIYVGQSLFICNHSFDPV